MQQLLRLPWKNLQLPTAPPVQSAPSSDFYNISNPTGHTTEAGTTSTFNVACCKNPVHTPAAPSAPSSDFYNISTPSGHTSEAGTTSTFNVSLEKMHLRAAVGNLLPSRLTVMNISFQQMPELLSLKMQMTLASQPSCPSET